MGRANLSLETLPRYIRGMASLGQRPAVIERHLYRRARWSYAQLLERAEAFAAFLQHGGIGGGDRVLLWGQAGGSWAAAYYGCILAGAVVVPLDAGFSAGYADRIAAHTEARLLCSDHAEAIPGVRRLQFEELLQLPAATSRVPDLRPEPSSLLEIVYTSGATADPKGVMITHGNILANLRPIAHEIEKYKGKARLFLPLRFLHLIPPSHLFGQVMGLLLPPLLESAVVYAETQSAAGWAALIREERASVMVCVPQQLAVFAEWARAHGGGEQAGAATAARGHKILWRWWHWRRLHRKLGWKMWAFIVGGAALAGEQEEYWNALGYAVVQGYGLTETAPAIAITHPFKIRKGAVGRKLAGVEIRIAEDGEILVKGGNVSPGYYRDAVATGQAFEDGWLHTGDLGRLDEQGNLHFSGRKKEVIVTADGLNVYPEDVERALGAQPEVAECAVVERRQGGNGQVHAVAVPRAGFDERGLAAAVERANRRLEAHQRIRGVSVWPEAHLPRTAATHKPRRAAMAAWVNQGKMPEGPAAGEAANWREFVEQRWGVAAERLTPGARLSEDLGLSSLDRVELLTWMESHGAEGAVGELAAAGTVAELDAWAEPNDRPGPQRGVAALGPANEAAALSNSEWPLAGAARWARAAAVRGAMLPALHLAVRRLQVEGLENLAGGPGAVLFVANHQSLLDVPVIIQALPQEWRRSLAPAMGGDLITPYLGRSLPLWRRWLGRLRFAAIRLVLNTYLITPTGGVAAALRYSAKLLEIGYCPLLFPEGARTRDGQLHAFRPGVGLMVEELRIPVIPVVLEGLYEILPVTRRELRRGDARVRFGPVMRFEGERAEAITASLEAWFHGAGTGRS